MSGPKLGRVTLLTLIVGVNYSAWSIPFYLTVVGFGCVGLASVTSTCQPAPFWEQHPNT
jgi:hypothetical protein